MSALEPENTWSTEDGRKVRPIRNSDGSFTMVEELLPGKVKSNWLKDMFLALREALGTGPADTGLRILAARLSSAGLDFIGVCRTSVDPEDLTIYVLDEDRAEKVAHWLVSHGHVDTPHAKLGARRLELKDNLWFGGRLTLRVAVRAPMEEAKAVLEAADLGEIQKHMGPAGIGRTGVTVTVEGDRLVLNLPAAAAQTWDKWGPAMFMLSKGSAPQGAAVRLNWMGWDVEVREANTAWVSPEMPPMEQEALLRRIAEAAEQGEPMTVRFLEGHALGPPARLLGTADDSEGRLLVRCRVDGEEQLITSADFFSRNAEILFEG